MDKSRYHACDDATRRFWAKVNKETAADGCWLWTAKLARGYGHFAPHHGFPTAQAHRYAYELLVGPVAADLELDHLCRVRRCVNPAHLEPVTARENQLRAEGFPAANARKTSCPKGHAYDRANTIHRDGRRVCRTCANARSRQRQATPEQKARWAANRSARRRVAA